MGTSPFTASLTLFTRITETEKTPDIAVKATITVYGVPTMKGEIERLKKLVEESYWEGVEDRADGNESWDYSESKSMVRDRAYSRVFGRNGRLEQQSHGIVEKGTQDSYDRGYKDGQEAITGSTVNKHDMFSRDGVASYVLEHGPWVWLRKDGSMYQIIGISRDGVLTSAGLEWISFIDLSKAYTLQRGV